MQLRRVHVAGWSFLALAVAAVTAIVTVGALHAHGDAAFSRWVGWATVAAVPLTAVGVLLVLWDKATGSMTTAEADTSKTEDQLAAIVLAQAQEARSRLIAAWEPGDLAANVRFVKTSGRFREVGGDGGGDLASILEYYQSLSPGRLVIMGEPGAGKTVLAMELLVRMLESGQRDTSLPVPILISAASYDTRLSWEDWLTRHLALRFGIGAKTAARLVRDRRILPVVDGVDEMNAPGEAARAGTLVAALNASMRGRERAPVLVTCRRSEYQALMRELDRATHVEMVPLTGEEAASFLQDQFLDEDERQRWEPVLASLRADPGGPLASQLATPWRLTLALTAFHEEGDPAELVPTELRLADEAAEAYAHITVTVSR